VRKVDSYTLMLSTELRVRLYKEWRQNQDAGTLVRILEESGLGKELTGSDYYKTLIIGFKNGGYPVYKNTEIALMADYREKNPLLASGRFTRTDNGKGTCIAPDFERELFSHYPETSVEEGIRRAGLDPMDFGYQRIRKLKREFEAKHDSSVMKMFKKYRSENSDFGVNYMTKSGMKRCEFYNDGFKRNKCDAPQYADIMPQYRTQIKSTSLAGRIKSGKCEGCGASTVKIYMHHVKRLKDLNTDNEFEALMIGKRRKSLALCPLCFEKATNINT